MYAQIAKHVVDGFVTGINGTIFAYGQTGSGKTYTMLGDFGKLSTTRRGIVPRAVRAVFQYLEDKKTQACFKLILTLLLRTTITRCVCLGRQKLQLQSKPQFLGTLQ